MEQPTESCWINEAQSPCGRVLRGWNANGLAHSNLFSCWIRRKEVYGMFSSILIFLCFISYSTCNSNKYIGGFCLSSFCLFLLIDFLCVTDATLGQSRHQRFWCVGAFTAIIFNTSKTKLAKGRTFASQWHGRQKGSYLAERACFSFLNWIEGKMVETVVRCRLAVDWNRRWRLFSSHGLPFIPDYMEGTALTISRVRKIRERQQERERIKESQSIVTLLRMYIYPYVLHWVIT